jgi:H+-transporting ATPase
MGFDIGALRTLAMVALVFGSEATIYSVRERGRLWSSRPSMLVVVATVCDILIISTLVTRGIAMSPLPILVVAGTFAAATVFAFVLDFAKVPLFNLLKIA